MNAQPADILYDRSCAPAVLLFGDDAARRERLADRIILSGGRVSASEPIDTAADRLDGQAGARIVVDLREDGGAALDGLLMWLDAQAGRVGRLSTLILTPPGLIDVVTARSRISACASSSIPRAVNWRPRWRISSRRRRH